MSGHDSVKFNDQHAMKVCVHGVLVTHAMLPMITQLLHAGTFCSPLQDFDHVVDEL